MTGRDSVAGGDAPPGLTDRDADVIRAIEEEGLSAFTFDGLRRITGVHPETLSRTLGRLEGDGMVSRSADGYVLTERAKGSFGMRPAELSGRKVPILHTFLPHPSSARVIVAAFKGKWFDKVRWVGMSAGEEGVVMKWVTEDGKAVIDVLLSGGELNIQAGVKDESDLPSAIRAAHQLVGRVSKLYASPRPRSRPMLMQISYFSPFAM